MKRLTGVLGVIAYDQYVQENHPQDMDDPESAYASLWHMIASKDLSFCPETGMFKATFKGRVKGWFMTE